MPYVLRIYDRFRLAGYVEVSSEFRARRLIDLLDEPGRIVWLEESCLSTEQSGQGAVNAINT